MKYDDGPGIRVEQNQRVVLNSRPGVEFGEDRKNEACVSVKEAGVALCYAWKVDNSGPHSKLGVELIRDKIRILFPVQSKSRPHRLMIFSNEFGASEIHYRL